MEAIFDTVFGNILVLLAIVGGIVGFIKDRSKKEDQSRRPYTPPNPTPTPSVGYDVPSEEKSYEVSVENQQTYRMEEQQDTNIHRAVKNGEHDAIAKSTLRKPSNGLNKNKRMKRQIKSNLSKQGLVNGVIMSEVLGSPRATKPYRSVITERRK